MRLPRCCVDGWIQSKSTNKTGVKLKVMEKGERAARKKGLLLSLRFGSTTHAARAEGEGGLSNVGALWEAATRDAITTTVTPSTHP